MTWYLFLEWKAWVRNSRFPRRRRSWSCATDPWFQAPSTSDRTHPESGQSEFQIAPELLLTEFWVEQDQRRQSRVWIYIFLWKASSESEPKSYLKYMQLLTIKIEKQDLLGQVSRGQKMGELKWYYEAYTFCKTYQCTNSHQYQILMPIRK